MYVYSNVQLSQRRGHSPQTGIKRRVFLFIMIVFLLLLASLYLVRFVAIHRLERQVADLCVTEQTALHDQGVLRARLAKKDDPQAIEDVAREKLGLVKPGEQLIIFVKGD